jgi:hypothetical protein
MTRTMPASGLPARRNLVEVRDQRLDVGAAIGNSPPSIPKGNPRRRARWYHEVANLALVAREDDEVAHLVDADRVVRRERREDLLHLARAHELERHHDDGKPWGIGRAGPPSCGEMEPRTWAIGRTL